MTDLLAQRDVEIIDADVIARDVVAPGTPGLAEIVARFGESVIKPDGSLDRHKLAGIVFGDRIEREALEAIVHPLVRAAVTQRLDELRSTDKTVLLVVPLLVESGHYPVDRLVVVDVDENIAVQRVMHDRGWTELHARQRIASQISREDRLVAADYVIDNNGSKQSLEEKVNGLWRWLGLA